MKKLKTLLVLMIILLTGSTVIGQEDNPLGAILEAARAAQGAAGEAESEANSNSNEISESDRRKWEQWRKEFEEQFKTDLDELSNDAKCIAMMALYVHNYQKLMKKTDAESNCKMKYDLYGMQLLALAASTTFMYCPEGINKLSEDDKYVALEKFFFGNYTTIGSSGPSPFHDTPWGKLLKEMNTYTDLVSYVEKVDWMDEILIGFFKPENILVKSFQIGQKMEALGCGG